MVNDMKKYKYLLTPTITALLVVGLCLASYFLFKLDKETTANLCKILLIITCSFLVGCSVSCYNQIKNSTNEVITKEDIRSWIKESVTKTIQIEADKDLTSQLGAINQQIAKLDESLHKDLQDVLLTKNTNLKFIQEMAHSIGKDGSAWKEEHVKNFMICLNAIAGMQNEDVKRSDVGSSKIEQTDKKNDGSSNFKEKAK